MWHHIATSSFYNRNSSYPTAPGYVRKTSYNDDLHDLQHLRLQLTIISQYIFQLRSKNIGLNLLSTLREIASDIPKYFDWFKYCNRKIDKMYFFKKSKTIHAITTFVRHDVIRIIKKI